MTTALEQAIADEEARYAKKVARLQERAAAHERRVTQALLGVIQREYPGVYAKARVEAERLVAEAVAVRSRRAKRAHEEVAFAESIETLYAEIEADARRSDAGDGDAAVA